MKSFTLIEIVITIVLVAFVLAMVTGMGKWFSERVRFDNTKEEITSIIDNVLQEAATTSSVVVGSGTKRFGSLLLMMTSGSTISRSYSSGELVDEITEQRTVRHGMIWTTGFSALLSPYGIGCDIGDDTSEFSIVSAENLNLQACYRLVAASCKLQQIACQ